MLAIVNTITSFLGDFASGRLNESSTHWLLICVIAAAEISLGVGIWIESPKNKTLREWMGCSFSIVWLRCERAVHGISIIFRRRHKATRNNQKSSH
jgi:hypothetical protein